MKVQFNRYTQIVLIVILLALTSTPAWAQDPTAPPNWVAPAKNFIYFIVFFVVIASFLAVLFVCRALNCSKWSLADALSEEVEVTMTTTANNVTNPVLGASGTPLMSTELCASSSRLVALMGMVVILMMFIGFGATMLFSFAKTGNIPSSASGVIKFLVGGLTLFAPYVVNKFASIFESISPKKC
jgi:hypothetical protein